MSGAGESLLHTRCSKATRPFFSVMSSHGGGAKDAEVPKNRNASVRGGGGSATRRVQKLRKGGCGRSKEAPEARDLDWRIAGQTGAPRSVGLP